MWNSCLITSAQTVQVCIIAFFLTTFELSNSRMPAHINSESFYLSQVLSWLSPAEQAGRMAIGSWQSGGLSILNLLPNHCLPSHPLSFSIFILICLQQNDEFYHFASSFIIEANSLPIETSVDSNKGDRQLSLSISKTRLNYSPFQYSLCHCQYHRECDLWDNLCFAACVLSTFLSYSGDLAMT